jgi:hypothetical protein
MNALSKAFDYFSRGTPTLKARPPVIFAYSPAWLGRFYYCPASCLRRPDIVVRYGDRANVRDRGWAHRGILLPRSYRTGHTRLQFDPHALACVRLSFSPSSILFILLLLLSSRFQAIASLLSFCSPTLGTITHKTLINHNRKDVYLRSKRVRLWPPGMGPHENTMPQVLS